MPLYIRLFFISLLIAIFADSGAQDTYPKDYFRSPVDFRIYLSGTFGELRSNHFHSGIDIKTNGKTGKNIYAIADGYVSRIKVSTWGFGNTLYVTHPNGYVSVYAHLKKYNKEVADWLMMKHYEKESFEMDLFPEKGQFTVKKGEVIAYSGTSGYSFGPHLHFEIRKEASQKPVNPLLFGIEVKDYIRPKIQALKVYPFTENTLINGKNQSTTYLTEGWGEEYRLPDKDTVEVNGPFYLGIRTHDLLNDASNKNGVYSIEIRIDDSTVYFHNLESFSFAESRYINSLLDYPEYVDNKRRYQESKIDPNNKLSIYKSVVNEGIVEFDTDGVYSIDYIVKDVKNNTSKLNFKVNYTEREDSVSYAVSDDNEAGVWFIYDGENSFSNENLEFDAPGNAFYDSFLFEYQIDEVPDGAYSALHHVHQKTTPIHRHCNLSIRVNDSLAEDLYEKALLASQADKDDWVSAGGEFKDGFVKARIRNFGSYCVMIDTVPPEIKARKASSFKNLAGVKKVSFTIRDEFSGIKEYRGELNGNWLLMQFDAKNDLLYYEIDHRLKKGKNSFKLSVTDGKGNVTDYEAVWVR